MPERNTGILCQIIECLGDLVQQPQEALTRLEEHYSQKLLVVAGDTHLIEQQAQELRLAITTHEASQVLDYLAEKELLQIPIETTDEVINSLFPDRFQEP
jgi:DNA integrity scanning protein DisA with diadenylate cyclase activity